jgi:HEAT repeat protein
VTSGLTKTLGYLAKTENEAAVQLLITALDAPDRAIAQSSLRALLQRRSVAGHREIIHRLHSFDEGWRGIVAEYPARMSQALRDAVLDADPQVCANGCQAILRFREYDLIPTLVKAAENLSDSQSSLVAKTLLELCGLLYEELASPRDTQKRRDPQFDRRNATAALQDSLQRFAHHKRSEIIECFLLLAGRENAALMQILSDPMHPSFVPVAQMLTHGTHPGLIRLVLGHLDNAQTPTALLSVIAHRCDRRFVEQLLRRIGHTPTASARSNLKRIESIAWLKNGYALLDELDDAAQYGAVQMVIATRMKQADAYKMIEHLAHHGKPGGRRAAAAALTKFPGAEASQLTLELLKDSDPQVQAAALRQLRQRGIPGALPTLLAMVDSQHLVVRQAARESLAEFSFSRYLHAFDMLEPNVARSTGLLVKRIDIQTLSILRQELQSSSGKRRMRAVDIARIIEVVPQIEETLIELLASPDHLVRASTAAALGDSSTPAALSALNEACHDSSLIVQEAALGALGEIARRAQAPASQPPASQSEAPTDETLS